MAGMLRVPRSRGAISGLLLVLLGIWGGLAIFIGPYLGYGYAPNSAWFYTTIRLYMVILPAAATVVGGLMAVLSANRATALLGAWLAALGGAWFVLGGVFGPLWRGTANPMGMPLGTGLVHRALETIGLFSGLGVVIVFLAAMSIGRFTVRSHREVAAAEAERTLAGGPASAAGMAGYQAGRTGAPAREPTGEEPAAGTGDDRTLDEPHGAHAAQSDARRDTSGPDAT